MLIIKPDILKLNFSNNIFPDNFHCIFTARQSCWLIFLFWQKIWWEEDWSFCLSGWNLHLSSQFPIFQQGWISSATQAREATGEGKIEREHFFVKISPWWTWCRYFYLFPDLLCHKLVKSVKLLKYIRSRVLWGPWRLGCKRLEFWNLKLLILECFCNLNSIHKYKWTQRVHRPRLCSLAVAFPIKTLDWTVMVGGSDVLSTLLQRNVIYNAPSLKCGFLSDIWVFTPLFALSDVLSVKTFRLIFGLSRYVLIRLFSPLESSFNN